MIGEKYADVARPEMLNNLFDIAHGDRVYSGEGFVEQDEFRIGGQRARNLCSSALPARQAHTLVVPDMLYVELVREGIPVLTRRSRRYSALCAFPKWREYCPRR